MAKINRQAIPAKVRLALLHSWQTEHGQQQLCTGPITWNPYIDGGNAFEQFSAYGWSVQRVNEELTEALYDEAADLIAPITRDLLEMAQAEWAEEQAGILRAESLNV